MTNLCRKKLNLDLVAMYYMPTDMPSALAPVQIEGDGNCLPRTISYLLSKSQEMYTEIRVCIVYEAVRNIDKYLDHIYISKGALYLTSMLNTQITIIHMPHSTW